MKRGNAECGMKPGRSNLRPRRKAHGDTSCVAHGHTAPFSALQNAATGRWTTSTRALLEKGEILEKDGPLLVFFQFSQSFSALKTIGSLEKDEAGEEIAGEGWGECGVRNSECEGHGRMNRGWKMARECSAARRSRVRCWRTCLRVME